MLWLYLALGGLFGIITWKHFRFGLYLFIVALPTYLIRFTVGPLPTTLLEMLFGVLALVWLVRYARHDWPRLVTFFSHNKLLFWSLCLFFVASVISIFISDMWYFSFGQWRAYFLEPIAFFIILIGRRDTLVMRNMALALLVSTISISALGVVQKITGQFFPPSLWDDQLFGRVTSFFTSPNAAALYLAPLLPLVALLWKESKTKQVIAIGAALLMLATLYFTHSLGAHLALAAGALVFFAALGYKKIVAGTLLVILIIFLLPHTKAVLATKAQSASNRQVLWSMSWNYLTESPKHFIFGTGIRQFFRKVQKPEYNPKELERLIYPHNIFLNFWTEIGLFGMLGFIGILIALKKSALSVWRSNKLVGATLLTMLTVFIVHGLVDVPYFKNDLSYLFWALTALIFTTTKTAAEGDRSK